MQSLDALEHGEHVVWSLLPVGKDMSSVGDPFGHAAATESLVPRKLVNLSLRLPFQAV
jgi:hypothetical protein